MDGDSAQDSGLPHARIPFYHSPLLRDNSDHAAYFFLYFHEPIRSMLQEAEDALSQADFIKHPWKARSFLLWLTSTFQVYIKRHHQAEEMVYFKWLSRKIGSGSIQKFVALHRRLDASIEDLVTHASFLADPFQIQVISLNALKAPVAGLVTNEPSPRKRKDKKGEGAPPSHSGTSTSNNPAAQEEAEAPPPPHPLGPRSPLDPPLTPEERQRLIKEGGQELLRKFRELADSFRRCLNEEEETLVPLATRYGSKEELHQVMENVATTGIEVADVELPLVLMSLNRWATEEQERQFLEEMNPLARYTLDNVWVPNFERRNMGLLESLTETEPPKQVVLAQAVSQSTQCLVS